jgi:tripartite-type tricarboxylate transporter receptor subunit TctC
MRAVTLLVLAAWLLVGQAGAQESFPEHDIRLIIPFGPGGASDRLLRVVAAEAERHLGVAVRVENVPGAGAIRGAQRVKEAVPDGYTLLGSHQTLDLSWLAGEAEFSHRAFAPVAMVTRTINIPAVRHDHPLRSVGELRAWVEQQQGEVYVGVIPHSTDHLFWLQLLREARVARDRVKLVRYPDTGSQVLALAAGELDLAMVNLPSAGRLFASGVLRPLGVAHGERLAALPEVPTLSEQGLQVRHATERGIFAPRGTPPERLAQLADAFGRAVQSPEMMRRIEAEMGSLVSFLPPEEYVAYLAERQAELTALAEGLKFGK